MSSAVLDASALLALIQGEPGGDAVAEAVALGATMSTVNLSEVVAKLVDAGRADQEIRRQLDMLSIEVADFDYSLALHTGLLRSATRGQGLSLGDRACVALGQQLNLAVLTCDRTWDKLALNLTVQVIR